MDDRIEYSVIDTFSLGSLLSTGKLHLVLGQFSFGIKSSFQWCTLHDATNDVLNMTSPTRPLHEIDLLLFSAFEH